MKLTTLMLAVCLAVPAFAQDPFKDATKALSPNDSPKFYKLDFVVKELDDNKVVSAKNYSTFTSADGVNRGGCSIRTGNRVPYLVAAGNYQYADIGVNIDCQSARESGGLLLLTVTAEITSIPAGNEGPPNMLPTIRQNKWNSMVPIPIGKSTTLFSSDDLNSKRKLQLEVTATQIK